MDLMTTPERTADTGAGAEGWASGSQAWKGISPALSPKPARNRALAKSTVAEVGIRLIIFPISAIFRVPVRLYRKAIPKRIRADATVPITWYLKPASNASASVVKATNA